MELIAATVVLASIAAVSSALLVGVLRTRRTVITQDDLDRMATISLLRIEEHVREATAIYIPNGHDLTRGVLAVAHRFDDDNDGLFDEDAAGAGDGQHGVLGFDDDGDGLIDEGNVADDDEDGLVDEDPIDGVDNDGDGLIDEDFGADMDGVGGDDDDGDGLTDEDGAPGIVYYRDGTDLMEWHPVLGTNAIARNVSEFNVTLVPAASSQALPTVIVEIKFQGSVGQTRTLTTRVAARNYGLYGS